MLQDHEPNNSRHNPQTESNSSPHWPSLSLVASRINRDAHEAAFLHRKVLAAVCPTLITAAIAAAMFWLFLESRHCAQVVPARAIQIFVVLVPIFLQSAPHMAIGLVAAESS